MLDDAVVLPDGGEQGGERQQHYRHIDQKQVGKHAASWRTGLSLPSLQLAGAKRQTPGALRV
ncbi:MAG: hypothetical protein J0J01_19945 [Reyranella sp.]|uniref:hypothetical protein n=1 Tax=Reyranella sp. TaxID=1929291 RepID=UPI001AC44F7C|nr:hypothetical protein [Reyranella sp.]MBN9089185.1 hypothetical protein [Reyranella sp.]